MMNQLFFELIQVAIGTRTCLSHTPSKGEWAELYAMSKKQSLVGICFSAVQKLTQNLDPRTQNLDKVQYLTWMGMAAKIQQRNEVVNRQCADLQKRISADGFRSYIMKGQAVGTLYTSTGSAQVQSLAGLRQSGDIDVYLEGGLDKILAYAKSIGKTDGVNELEMHVEVFLDTEVEFHYRPMVLRDPFKNRRLQQ